MSRRTIHAFHENGTQAPVDDSWKAVHQSVASPEMLRQEIEQAMGVLKEDDDNLLAVSKNVKNQLFHVLRDVRKDQGQSLADLKDEHTQRERREALLALSCVPPFSYLPAIERKKLVSDMHVVNFSDGAIIVQQGSRKNDVFVTSTGRVMLVEVKDATALGESPKISFLGYLDAKAYFGDWEALFQIPRKAQVIAGGNVKAFRMSAQRFESLLQHKGFRIKLSLGLRKSGIFSAIDNFVAVVRREVNFEKVVDFAEIMKSYKRMEPAIHAKLHSSELDTNGWMYAVRRLPDAITSTYVYLLSNTIPLPFMHHNFDLKEISVPTEARRRLAFAIDHGKLLVLMRENFSDVLDFMSLLCAHVHESAKLRLKLNKHAALDAIHNCLWSPERRVNLETSANPTNSRLDRSAHYTRASVREQAKALEMLPLTKEECLGLQALWPKDFLYRIWDIVVLHENIQITADFADSSEDASDRWAERIRRGAIELLTRNMSGNETEEPICVNSGITTHIISSNTTSVRNLLSPYIQKNKSIIRKWGLDAHQEIENEDDLSESEKLYALCNEYMRVHPGATSEQDTFDSECFKVLRNTELTGIQVELIDLGALENVYNKHNIDPDPYLAQYFGGSAQHQGCQKTLLVNIDYAFGKQAAHLISALVLLFGESIQSVGIMGKAGGLQGKRGDLIVADYLVHQEGDEITPIDNGGVDRAALGKVTNGSIWSGGVLTVLGTLLQDNNLLQYYKKLYRCVSLEMEGSFYARELMRFKKARLLPQDVPFRFLYYVSDTPLSKDQGETLAKDLSLAEVIPQQYAVTRELLRLVLNAKL